MDEKEKTKGASGLGRITEQTEKWNQMTGLRFQTGGRHQKSPASLWCPTTQYTHEYKSALLKWDLL